jgi:outer membrane immunogenic protein
LDVQKPRLRQAAKASPQDKALLFGFALLASFVVGDGSGNATEFANPLETSAPAYSWTGFYAGVNAGYATDHFAFHQYYDSETSESGITSHGAVAGAQIGYNYEFTNLPFIDHAVAGVELDTDWAGVGGSVTVNSTPGPVSFGTKFENFGTLRLRAGYNFDRLLLYFTGGQTFSTVEASYSAPGIAGSVTATRTGVISQTGVVGCGLEYALSNNISVKAEYLYDFTGARFEQFSAGGHAIGFGNRSMYHIARFGLNYKFDWFSPSTPVAER